MAFSIALFAAAVLFVCVGAAVGYWIGRRKPETPVELVSAIGRIESQIREVERQQQHALGGLDHHLSALGKETTALSQALRVPQARGRWGELTLRRVAELSGMSNYCDFQEQVTAGASRPDMIVHLPGGRVIAVDAKAPLSGYLDAESAATEGERNAALDRHAQALARHAAGLSQREYWAQLQPAPDLVVLFLPGDHFLSAA